MQLLRQLPGLALWQPGLQTLRRQEDLVLSVSKVPHPGPGPGGAQGPEDAEDAQGTRDEGRQQR